MVAPLAASAIALSIALTGCTASSSESAAQSSTSTPSVTPTVTTTPSANPVAAKAIARAVRAMGLVRSYRFVADEQLIAASTQRTHLTGSLVRGQGLTYRLTVGRKTTEVVRLRAATYVRVVPRRWSRLRHPRRLLNPTATLLQLLRGLQPLRVASSHDVTAVHGSLPPAAARAAGLPADKSADVTVTMDGLGRVVVLDVRTSTSVGGHDVTVRLRTAYSDFGQVARIRRPV